MASNTRAVIPIWSRSQREVEDVELLDEVKADDPAIHAAAIAIAREAAQGGAGSCGFADQSHMNRVSRKRVGQTPGQFRASASR